jgi:hypothetical protein
VTTIHIEIPEGGPYVDGFPPTAWQVTLDDGAITRGEATSAKGAFRAARRAIRRPHRYSWTRYWPDHTETRTPGAKKPATRGDGR